MISQIDKHAALVLIDLQKGVVKMPVAHPMDAILKNCAALVAAFRKANLPVVIVSVNPAGPWTQTRKETPSAGTANYPADWREITPEIQTQPTDIFITKPSWGAFYGTTLNDELVKQHITGIVLAGVATIIGVEGTARQAVLHGYNLAFATDAMTDRFIDAHEHSIKYIFPRIGETGTSQEIIEKMEAAG